MKDQDRVIAQMKKCTACKLHRSRTQVVVGDYGPKEGICFIGEAPGRNEDQQGRPFVGRSGQLLDKMLESIGYTRDQVSVLNINKCRPPENRTPTAQERQTCGTLWLDIQLQYLDPILLVTLGATALNYFLPNKRITRVRAELQQRDDRPPIMPLFHPAYVLRGGLSRQEYKQDFDKLRDLVNNPENLDNGRSDGQSNLEDYF